MFKYVHDDHDHFYKVYELPALGSHHKQYEINSHKGNELQTLRVDEDDFNQFINRLFENGWKEAP